MTTCRHSATVRHVPDDEWSYNTTLLTAGKPHFSIGRVNALRRRDGWSVDTEWVSLRGRAEPCKLTVTAPPDTAVTTDVVRRLPLGAVLAGSRVELHAVASMANRTETTAVDEAFTKASGSHRGRSLDDDELRAVAGVYRRAWGLGAPVNEAVRAAFVLSRDGAAKRIMAARRAGMLDGVGPKR